MKGGTRTQGQKWSMLRVSRCVTESKCDLGGLYNPERRQTCTGSPEAALAAIWRCHASGGTPGSTQQVKHHAQIVRPRKT